MIERYTRVSPDSLRYEATIEDPKVFSRPWKISMPLYRRLEKNVQLVEFKCVEFVEELMYKVFASPASNVTTRSRERERGVARSFTSMSVLSVPTPALVGISRRLAPRHKRPRRNPPRPAAVRKVDADLAHGGRAARPAGDLVVRTLTPLERPKAFADKEFLAEAEVAALEATALVDDSDDAPTRAGDTGTYNQFWFDYGTKVVPSRRTSLIDPREGRMPPLTPEAQKKRAAAVAYQRAHPSDTWVDRGPNERCVARPFPRMTSSYKHGIQVLQVPGYVVIHYEYFHDTRIIPLDGRPHLDRGVQQWNGNPRGHWEGNTLVVESTNFSDQQDMLVRGTPGLGQGSLRLIERLTRLAPDVLNYEATFVNPTTWTKPWTLESPWHPDTSLHYEDACHEGNHSIVGILSGARADEKKLRTN